jgi:hypothetical protein
MVLAQRLESGGRKLSPEDSDSGDKASRVRRTHSMTTSCKLRETRSSSSLSGPVVHVDNHSSDPQGGLRFLVAKRRTREKKPAAQDMTTTARLVPSSSSAKRVHMCALHLSSSRARSCLHRVYIPSRQMRLTSRWSANSTSPHGAAHAKKKASRHLASQMSLILHPIVASLVHCSGAR